MIWSMIKWNSLYNTEFYLCHFILADFEHLNGQVEHEDFFPTDPGVKMEDLEGEDANVEHDDNYEPDFEVRHVM